MPGLSALRLIRRLGALLGRRLLVTEATGAVGHFAIQLGKLAGAEVIASVRDLGSEGCLRDLGATAVVAGLSDIAAPVYGVIDAVGGPQLAEAFDSELAFVESLRRGHGGLAMDEPVLLRVAIAFAKLAEAI